MKAEREEAAALLQDKMFSYSSVKEQVNEFAPILDLYFEDIGNIAVMLRTLLHTWVLSEQ